MLVVELSDELAARHEASAGSCCAMLASAGATVVRIVSRGGGAEGWGGHGGGAAGAWGAQVDRGKVVTTPRALEASGSSAFDLCSRAGAIVTGLGGAALRSAGRWGAGWDWAAVEARASAAAAAAAAGGDACAAGLVLTRITPWGVLHEAEAEAAAASAAPAGKAAAAQRPTSIVEAMFAATGFGSEFQGALIDPPSLDGADEAAAGMGEAARRDTPRLTLPRHFLSMLASCFALSGTAAALCGASFALGGRVVDVSFASCGLWFAQSDHLMWRPENRRAAEFQQLFRGTALTFTRALPPTFNTYLTKDGVAVQLLGLDWIGQLNKFVSGLGIGWQAWPALFRAVFFDLLPRYRELRDAGPGAISLVAMAAVPPVRQHFAQRIGELTWAQFAALAAAKDLWYTRVHTPAEAYRYRHAEQCGAFTEVAGRRTVAAPLVMGGRQWQTMAAAVDARSPPAGERLRQLVGAIRAGTLPSWAAAARDGAALSPSPASSAAPAARAPLPCGAGGLLRPRL